MKMKHIAAATIAACAAAAAAPAFAGIGTGALDNSTANNAELVFVLFDEGRSFTKDLGITLQSFLATANTSFTSSLASANFSTYLGADTNLFDGTKTSGTRWALLAVNSEPFAANSGRVLLTTLDPTQGPTSINNGDWFQGVETLGAKFNDLSQVMNANGTANLTVGTNGDAYTAAGSQGYFNDGGLNALGFSYYITNVVGASSAAYIESETTDTAEPPISATAVAGRFSFNGTQLAYTVSAVPEPGSLAMVLAGFGALGFVSRRRRNQDNA